MSMSSYFEDVRAVPGYNRGGLGPLNTGRGGRRTGAGRKPLPEALKRQRRAMRKQITISWNLCQEWEGKKALVGIKRDREFLQYLLHQTEGSRQNGQAVKDDDNPLGTMADFVTYVNQLRHDQKLCDVTFVIKEGAETTYVHAHKMVLMMTSRYFKGLSREELASRNEFYLQDVTLKGLELLLDYMYGQVIDSVEHYKHLQQCTQAASVLQVDVYLENARAIARKGRKMMETNQVSDSNGQNGHQAQTGYYVMMANGQPGLMVPYPYSAEQQNDGTNTTNSSDVEIRESSAEVDDGSLVSEQSASLAASALDDAYVIIAKPKKFKCTFCPKIFKLRVMLQKHKRLMHTYRYTTWMYRRRKIMAYLKPTEKANNTCKLCNSSFANPTDLKRHNATVHKYIRVPKAQKPSDGSEVPSQIPCTLCDEVLESKKLLKEHIFTKHRQRSERLQCSKCPRTFAVKESLENHMKYRHNETSRTLLASAPVQEIPQVAANKPVSKPDGKSPESGTRIFDSIAALRQLAKPAAPPVQRPQQPVQKTQLRCHICSLTYNHKSLLMKHIQIVHQSQEAPPQPAAHPPPPPPLTRAPTGVDSEKQAWRCHICELPFGFHWSLIRHLELVHRIVGTHLDGTKKDFQEPQEIRPYPSPKPEYRRSKTKTVRQLIEQNQEPHQVVQDGPTIKEILERKIRRREDRSLQHLEDRFGSTSMVPNTRFGELLYEYERASPAANEYSDIASPQQLTAMVQAPLMPFNTSPQNSSSKDSATQNQEPEFDSDGFSMPHAPEDRNARRRHRLTGQNEPVPQPPVEHERILSTRVNIQRPAYSQMTFKLVKSKKDPKGESELKLWPQHREIYDCSGCGQAFSRYPSYAKHVVKCVGELPEVTMPGMDSISEEVSSERKRVSKPRPVRHYDFKEYCPPENKFRYQYSV